MYSNRTMDIKKLLGAGSLGWHATRDAVRKRDNFTCKLCGKKQEEGKRQLDVHHLNEEDEGQDGAFKEKHNMDEMITLCRKCHMNLPVVRRKMSEGRGTPKI